MNQIIFNKHYVLPSEHDFLDNDKTNNNLFNRKRKFLKLQFFLLFSVSFATLAYYLYFSYDLYAYEKMSKNIMNSFELTKIYQNASDYSAKRINSEETFFYENSSFSIIGTIDISKINISYPILSDISKDFLKISPCRFYGPMPNKVR